MSRKVINEVIEAVSVALEPITENVKVEKPEYAYIFILSDAEQLRFIAQADFVGMVSALSNTMIHDNGFREAVEIALNGVNDYIIRESTTPKVVSINKNKEVN